MANERTPRDTQTTEAFFRPESWAPAQVLPEFVPHPDWAYRWIRTAMVGTPDALNVSSKMREGWEPVKRSEHPEIKLLHVGDSSFQDSIETGGLILCKCPKDYIDQRTKYYRGQTAMQAASVDNSLMRENDARMPLFKESKTKVSFGSGSN